MSTISYRTRVMEEVYGNNGEYRRSNLGVLNAVSKEQAELMAEALQTIKHVRAEASISVSIYRTKVEVPLRDARRLVEELRDASDEMLEALTAPPKTPEFKMPAVKPILV